MKKILLSLLICFVFSSCVFANEISRHIKKTNFGIGSKISVFAINTNNGDVIYKKNEDKSFIPASTLKALTFGASYKVLGSDYQFETAIYKDLNNDLYLKLGGDTLLSQKDLNNLISLIKNEKFNEIYIDDSIFDKEFYPSTWLDEDKWPKARMITPYIIDNNYTQVSLVRSSLSKRVEIVQNDEYKAPFINELKIGDKKSITFERLYGEDSPIINLRGEICEDEIMNLPVLKPDIHFNVKLRLALEKNDIVHPNIFEVKIVPQDAKKIASVTHSINQIGKRILHNSDNFTAETVLKVAANKYYNKTASFDDGIKMLNELFKYNYSKNDVIVDASGVSRENNLSTKTIVSILSQLFKDENFRNLFATSTNGTMADRLLFLKDNLKAKTGTMREVSSLCGTFKTRKGTDVIFAMIEQDPKLRNALLKNYENTLLGIIYKKY